MGIFEYEIGNKIKERVVKCKVKVIIRVSSGNKGFSCNVE